MAIKYKAKAISGSAKVHLYVNNEEEKINGYKYISEFSVDEKDSSSHFDSISKEISFHQNLVFGVDKYSIEFA